MAPRYNIGDRVHIRKAGVTKVVESSRWDGGDWVYTVQGSDGTLDEGWLEHELRCTKRVR